MGLSQLENVDKIVREAERKVKDSKQILLRPVSLTESFASSEYAEDHEDIFIDENFRLNVKRISGNSVEFPFLAIDSSSVKIAETDRGIIACYRVGVIVHAESNRRIIRMGPYLIEVNEWNKLEIYNYFRSALNLDPMDARSLPKIEKMIDRIRNFIERLIQRAASTLIKNGLILWDGSLMGGTIDTPAEVVRKSIKLSHKYGNSVIGVSKHSRLRLIDGRRIEDLLLGVRKACYVDVHRFIKAKEPGRYFGRVFVAKFTPYGFPFRVDVAPAPGLTVDDCISAIASLCSTFSGYPEPLRQAHINSYLTSAEVLALQIYAIRKYRVAPAPSLSLDKAVLSPFR